MADLSCSDFVELVTAYLDGALDPDTTVEFEDHMAQCPGCRTYFDQMRETIERLGEIPVETISAEAQETLLAAFRAFPRP